jgi:Flp pilus assembly pilin Flp
VTVHRRSDDSGASAVEYGLIIAAIILVVSSSIIMFGQQVFELQNSSFSRISQCITGSCPPNNP